MDNFGKETILVCGGAGFIGSNLIRLILKSSPKAHIVCLDALTYAGNRNTLRDLPHRRISFVKGDITDSKLVMRIFKKFKPTYIANCAAETHVDRSIHGAARSFLRTNVEGAAVLLQAASSAPYLKKFLHVSTDEVYGSLPLGGKRQFTEQSPLLPNSPYASSKAASDLVARSFYKTYGVPVVITRCSNNYGPYQHPEKFIPFSILRLQKGKKITLYGDGKYVRDWVQVEDHCRALILALLRGKPGEVYNVGAHDEVSNLTIAHRLVSYFNKGKSAIAHIKDRPGHDRRYAIDASKIRRELRWQPMHDFDTSFQSTVRWYEEHTDWVAQMERRAGAVNPHI